MIKDVDFPDHGEVFNGQNGDLSLFDLIDAGGLCQDGDAQIFSDQVLDGGNVEKLFLA